MANSQNLNLIGSKTIDGFTPTMGFTYNGVTTLTRAVVVRFGKDVVITIDGASCNYTEGEVAILLDGITYNFATSTPVHAMYIA